MSAVIPQSFIEQTGGVVVENHLNMVYASRKANVGPEALSVILNSAAADRAFRCISGSVAVSAYELEALPLPSVDQVKSIEAMIRRGANKNDVEVKIASFYQEQCAQ